jgi:deoxycytidylate deaminase
MYAAKSASLRSSDLSRQVGAAIFSDEGELITQGCNEVPKALGGTYWDLEEPDFRDVRLGYDPNDILKKELLRDLFDRMSKAELLSQKAIDLGPPGEMVDKLTFKADKGADQKDGPLANSDVMDLTEFGRVVHAEMCAICDAARLGRSVKHATLFCTTFPCHNCTKHILAAGIKRVVYMEPYPKSRAKDLHQNEIEIEKTTPGRVSFVPFLGIAPFRYRDIFQKGKRKNSDGTAKRWLNGIERPMIESSTEAYFDVEKNELGPLLGAAMPGPSADN